MEIEEDCLVNVSDTIKQLLKNIQSGYKKADDEIFADGNLFLTKYVKKGTISIDENEHHLQNTIECNVPSCHKIFPTVFSYETHYKSMHLYNCHHCKKHLPSAHLLDLHLSEQHDSFFAVQAERQPMYACFLEECKHKSQNSEERKDHCITVHKFPHNFRFDQMKPKMRKIDPATTAKMEIDEYETNTELMECSIATSNTLKHFSFGVKPTKTFNPKTSATKKTTKSTKKSGKATNALENDQTVIDLKNSLPSI